MNNFVLKACIIMLSLINIACKNDKANTHHKIEGMWDLVIMEKLDTNTLKWKEWNGGMQGHLLYDNQNNMSLHLLRKGYENFDLKFQNFSDSIPLEALKHLTGSYVYMGTYTHDKDLQIVEHTRISHSNPKDWGKKVKRKYLFNGDTLIITPAEKKNANLRLKWIKH